MYDPAEMMEIFAICVALAGIAYLRQLLLTSIKPTSVRRATLEYSICGDLILPTNFHEWIHLRLTDEPVRNLVDHCMVMGYSDAYVDPAAYKHFLCNNTVPEGIIAFKRTDDSHPIVSSRLADRSCRLCSDSSAMKSANVAVKDSLQFGAEPGWGFFHLNQTESSTRRTKFQYKPTKSTRKSSELGCVLEGIYTRNVSLVIGGRWTPASIKSSCTAATVEKTPGNQA